MSSNAENMTALDTIVKGGNKNLGLNLSSEQTSTVAPGNLKSEFVSIPAVSQPNWGSYFIFDVKERNCIISDTIINFNIGSISGMTSAPTNYPTFVQATFFSHKSRIGYQYCYYRYPVSNPAFTAQKFFHDDKDRVLINNMQGSYSSAVQRNTLATTTSNYYIKLRSFYNECAIPILSDARNLQIRCYTDSVANVVEKGSSGCGTSAATINSSNVIIKVIKLPSEIAQARLNAMVKTPEHNLFHNIRYSPFSISSCTSTSTIVLTPFVDNVAALFFTVRPTSALTGSGSYQFTKIKDFAILDSSSGNAVGGQVIPSSLALQYSNNLYSKSSYTAETDIGCNLACSVTDNKANVYCWSFSSNIVRALESGILV